MKRKLTHKERMDIFMKQKPGWVVDFDPSDEGTIEELQAKSLTEWYNIPIYEISPIEMANEVKELAQIMAWEYNNKHPLERKTYEDMWFFAEVAFTYYNNKHHESD